MKRKNKGSELNLEKLKTYEGFENMGEEEALEAIKNIKTMARILFLIYQGDIEKSKEEQQ